MQYTLTISVFALLLTAVAAIIDARTGHIPNFLTLPVIAIAPFVHGIAYGLKPALYALLAAVICGVIPFFLFCKGAMGGGDVKLFAAMGALLGILGGMEVQFFSFIAGSIFAMVLLAWRGTLWRALKGTGQILINPFRARSQRRPVQPEAMTMLRFGPAIFVGTVLALGQRLVEAWSWLSHH